MAGMFDFLSGIDPSQFKYDSGSSLSGMLSGGGMSMPSPAYVDPAGNPVDPTATSSVDPLEITPEPQPPPLHYDNTADVQKVQQSLADNPPQGGGDNPGLWGLLPKSIQHGTVRNFLGAIGDAFLMHAGQKPWYEERMQNQKIGNAMAGYANNPQAAIERIAATGAPNSIEMADKMEQNLQNLQIRKQIAEQNNNYRGAMIQSRNEGVFQRMAPMAAGMAQSIKDPETYKAVYNRLTTMAQRIDPSADPTSAWGLPAPDDWTPEMTDNAGMTGGQIKHNVTAEDSIAERARAANLAHGDRQASLRAHPQQITSAAMLNGVAQRIQNGTATATDQQIWNRYLHGTKGGGSGLHSSTISQPGSGPSQSDIDYLKHNPQVRAQFEAHFGKGSASKYVR